MQAQRIGTCEIKTGAGRWRPVSLSDARTLDAPVLRCPACHGPGGVLGTYTAAERYRFGHKRFHAGCPLSARFSGAPSSHPDALA